MNKRIVLVDGSGYLFRAFHALPPLMNAKGQPTGAILGVMNMIRRLEQDYTDAEIVIVFDPPGPTKRHEIYPEYKANRSSMPDDLRVQIEPLHRLLIAKGYPLCIVPEQEADDVIGTLAKLYVDQDYAVVICTGDKDFAQLVCDDIVLLDTMKGRMLDASGVMDKFGVRPDQIIDYLALVGDSADNIPGVMKVGPKTATKWLALYNDLDTLVQKSAEIKGKVGEYLRSAICDLPLYRQLVTICQTIELPFDWQQLSRASQDISTLQAQYQDLGFKTLLKDLSTETTVVKKSSFEIVLSASDLEKACLSLTVDKPVGLSVYAIIPDQPCDRPFIMQALSLTQDDKRFFIPSESLQDLNVTLDDRQVLTVLYHSLLSRCQVITQDVKQLLRLLLSFQLSVPSSLIDITVMAYGFKGAGRLALPALADSLLGRSLDTRDDVIGKGAKRLLFSEISSQTMGDMLITEAETSEALWKKIAQDQEEQGESQVSLYNEVDGPLIAVLAHMEHRGALLDLPLLRAQSQQMATQLSSLNQHAYALAGQEFNTASVKQLQSILFDHLGLPVLEKTPKGDPSTSESALAVLGEQFPLPKTILEIRSLAKLKSTYIDALPLLSYEERVHCSFQQTVTATGRLSCQNPNLQNIPIRTDNGRAVRRAFIAPEGFKLVSFDYSQIELRIMAHISKDQTLTSAFLLGEDVHNATAGEIFSMPAAEVGPAERRVAKIINFGLIYGMSAFGLAKQLGVDRPTAQAYIDRYFARYPGVKDYMEQTRVQASRDGFVQTALGRKIHLPDIKHNKVSIRKAAERAAINAPMQGTAAELIKLAMLSVQPVLAEYPESAFLTVQVHDELVFEIKESLVAAMVPKISQVMTSVFSLDIPLVVNYKVGDNWGDMQ